MAQEARTLRALVAGTGFGCFTQVRALRRAGFEVAALVGRDARKTEERALRFGVPRALTSFADALAIPGVDAVAIATPPHTHAELALLALAAGRHVICEKPFARDAGEARELLAAAEAAGVVHLLGTEFRFDAGQATLARALASGAIGEPRLALYLMNVPLLADPAADLPEWWADAAQGGGWLGAHGSQVIDQVRFALGDFEAVSASLPRLVDRRGMTADDSFVVHFRMRSGLVGTLHSSAGDWGPWLVATRVSGSLGSLWIDGLTDAVHLADASGTRALPPIEALRSGPPDPAPADAFRSAYERMIGGHGLDLAPYTQLARVFRDRILGRALPDWARPATFADGVAQMEVLGAIRASAARGGEWVEVVS